MYKKENNVNKEGGNIVALTLLGLAIAIMAGVVVLYFVGNTSKQQTYKPAPADEEVFKDESLQTEKEINPREGWITYENSDYNFSIEFPKGWAVATGTLSTGDPAITVYKAKTASDTPQVYSPQDRVSHVSVYPLGVATEGITAKTKSSKVIVPVPQAFAKDYVLKSGKAWATEVKFDKYPKTWNSSGFVFARAVVEEEELIYMRGDTEIEQYEFDPNTGDHIERIGFIDSKIRSVEEEILRSFKFINTDNVKEEKVSLKSVYIDYPKSGDVVVSPLTISGKIKENVYRNDDVQIKLSDNEGNIISEIPVTNINESVENGYMPFELSVVFEDVTATSGKLFVVHNSSEEISIPILFD